MTYRTSKRENRPASKAASRTTGTGAAVDLSASSGRLMKPRSF